MEFHPASTTSQSTPDHKNRVRFGVKLPWPVANAATFVVYMTDSQWKSFSGAVDTVKSVLGQVPGGQQVADHLICETS